MDTTYSESKNKIEKEQQNKLNHLESIKSTYVLKSIFSYLHKKKSLEIIQKNKKLQEKLKISLNDYKKYSEKYSTIEIEIIPIKSKKGNFIHICRNEKKYYRIYFDNNKKKVKRDYLTKDDDVKKIKIVIDCKVKSFFALFEYCNVNESINFTKFSRNNIMNMSYMFNNCHSLKEINFYKYNTENVIDMSNMFKECSSLKKLDLSQFNTKNVIKMNHLFFYCSSLKNLIFSNFVTEKVQDMSYMFYECSALEKLNLMHFNTVTVTNMKGMFWGCSSIKEILYKFDTAKVTDMTKMFCECSSLEDLNISDFNVFNVKYMKSMFCGCSSELIKKIKAQNKNISDEAFILLY